jgi:Fe-S cluster assembly protein SufD
MAHDILSLVPNYEAPNRLILVDGECVEKRLTNIAADLSKNEIRLSVAKGAIQHDALEIIHLSTGKEYTSPQIKVTALENSEGSLSELFLGTGEYSRSGQTTIEIAANSRFTHNFFQNDSATAKNSSQLTLRQKAKSTFTSNVFHFGGGNVKNVADIFIGGENSEALLNGLSTLSGKTKVENITTLDHEQPNCFSRQIYKGVYSDYSVGDFFGTIVVRKPAQKTNAIQQNQSILLSDNATVDTKPQLKIWADDVKCTHGATIGQLDDEAMFYLQSRGVPKIEARKMLLQAFCGEVLEHLPEGGFRNYVSLLLA